MNTEKRDSTWIQCQNCGNLYLIDKNIPIDVSIVRSECPRCGEYSGLNVGDNEEDYYLYMNPNVDERYFYY